MHDISSRFGFLALFFLSSAVSLNQRRQMSDKSCWKSQARKIISSSLAKVFQVLVPLTNDLSKLGDLLMLKSLFRPARNFVITNQSWQRPPKTVHTSFVLRSNIDTFGFLNCHRCFICPGIQATWHPLFLTPVWSRMFGHPFYQSLFHQMKWQNRSVLKPS